MQSRVATPPPGDEGLAQALVAQSMPNTDMHAQPGGEGMAPPPTVRSAVSEIAKKITIQDLKMAGSFIFNLKIVAVSQVHINYDPNMATSNLNAALQDSFNAHSGIEGIPAHMYSVSYVKPEAGASSSAMDHGYFNCFVPAPFTDYTKIGTVMANLEFTGDDQGNKYKLAYEEFVPTTYETSRGGPRLRSKPTGPAPQLTPWWSITLCPPL